jgi:4-phosphopantoate---beta-alanine ligase
MTQFSKKHPRYSSLRRRALLAAATRTGLVVPEGLIAQGRAEAFDYLLGERTTASAHRAARIGAAWILAARHPVVSVNGNVAALDARGIARLARAAPSLGVEVNLFHRTRGRVRAVARTLQEAGVHPILGIGRTVRLPGLASGRARVDADGIGGADLCLIPLEDGDRAAALRRRGTRIIAIDLNPLSRTAQSADLTIVDELSRALRELTKEVRRLRRRPRERVRSIPNAVFLKEALSTMRQRLPRGSGARSGRAARGAGRGAFGRPR